MAQKQTQGLHSPIRIMQISKALGFKASDRTLVSRVFGVQFEGDGEFSFPRPPHGKTARQVARETHVSLGKIELLIDEITLKPSPSSPSRRK